MSRCTLTLAAAVPAEPLATNSFADDGMSRVGRSRGIGSAPNTAMSGTGKQRVGAAVGRVVAPTVARPLLYLNPTCDGRGDALNLKLKA